MSKRYSVQKRVAIYLRVSTGEQTTENQRRELQEVAMRHGWRVVEFFEDAGISGAKGRDRSPMSAHPTQRPDGARWLGPPLSPQAAMACPCRQA